MYSNQSCLGNGIPGPQHYFVAALQAVGFELATNGCQVMSGDVATTSRQRLGVAGLRPASEAF